MTATIETAAARVSKLVIVDPLHVHCPTCDATPWTACRGDQHFMLAAVHPDRTAAARDNLADALEAFARSILNTRRP